MYQVVSFYKFTRLSFLEDKRNHLLKTLTELDIKGLIILAEEGVNGTFSGPEEAVLEALDVIKKCVGSSLINLKEFQAKTSPFGRLKVKIKKEIVTFGVNNLSINEEVGRYVDPKDWNALIQNNNVALIDTRNEYEVAIGSFKGSINPKTKTFSDFPEWWKKNKEKYRGKSVAMFCTGGIRCEKSTKLLLKDGVKEVYHLNGGILNYLQKCEQKKDFWQGECFVFDQRVSVNSDLGKGSYELCHACRHPLKPEEKSNDLFEVGVSCEKCFKLTSKQQKENFRERQKQIKLSSLRGTKHLKYY